MGLLLHPADHHPRLSEVALGMARGMGQRHEHLPGLAMVLPYVVLDYGVLAVESVIVPEPLKDALGRVALLLGDPQSSSRIRPITPVKGSSLGLRGGLRLR